MECPPEFPDDSQAPKAAFEMAYRGIVRKVAEALGPRGIPVMPLKGVLFAFWIYERPLARLGGDIDLLVPWDSFRRAIGILEGEGFQVLPPHPNGNERTLKARNFAFEIDLHRALFAQGRYRLPTSVVFRRGIPDEALYSARVVLPDPYDAYAHVVGHAAANHRPALHPSVPRDLRILSAKFSLDPQTCASRLESAGLSRAARYILGFIEGEDPFARRTLESLRPDPAGADLVRLARDLSGRHPQMSPCSRAVGYLLNASLPRSALAFSVGIINRARLAAGFEPY